MHRDDARAASAASVRWEVWRKRSACVQSRCQGGCWVGFLITTATLCKLAGNVQVDVDVDPLMFCLGVCYRF